MRCTWWLRPTTARVALLLLALALGPSGIRADLDGPPDPAARDDPVQISVEQNVPEPVVDSSAKVRTPTLKGKKARRAAGAKSRKKYRAPKEPLPEPGTIQYVWHCLIWAYTYPFYYLHEHYGPFAANAFGIFLIMLVMVVPTLFQPKKERELKLKERLVRAKNTRIRVRAAQTADQYVAAVDALTRDTEELSLPLRGLRKMFKMPPASPVTYSKAIKGLRKETIHVNDNVYPVGQRSLDRAMQDLKSCLARELEVSEEEAGEMASTVVHRSNQPRTMDDPALALHALVADSAVVEIRSHDSAAEPLYISCLDGKVEVRRTSGFVVVIAGTDDPLIYVRLNFSINFRSTTDEGTLKLHRYRPGEKRREVPSEKKKKKDAQQSGLSRRGIDLWIDSKLFAVQRSVRRFTSMLPFSGPSANPKHGIVAEKVRVFAQAVQDSSNSDEIRLVIAEYLKTTEAVDITNASRALGLVLSEPLTDDAAEDKLRTASVSIDGVQVANVGAGIVHRVKAKLQRRITENSDGSLTAEQIQQLIDAAVRDGARLCSAIDVHRILLAVFRNQRLHVDVSHDRAYVQPLEITTEGSELVSEHKMLFSIVQVGDSGERSVVLQWIEVRHRNWTQQTKSGTRGTFSSMALKSHPAPRASVEPTRALPPVPKSQSKDNRVLLKVRQRLKQLKELERHKLGEPNSSSSSPTSSKYPSTVGSGRSSTGTTPPSSSPRLSFDATSSPRVSPPVGGSSPTSLDGKKPRSAALARAFLKRAGMSPTGSPAASGPDTPTSSAGTPTPPSMGTPTPPGLSSLAKGLTGASDMSPSPSVASEGSLSVDSASAASPSTVATEQSAEVLEQMDADALLLFDTYDTDGNGVLLRWQLEGLASLLQHAGVDADLYVRHWDLDRKVHRTEFVARTREIITAESSAAFSTVATELQRHADSPGVQQGNRAWEDADVLSRAAGEVFESYDWDGDGLVAGRAVQAVLEALAAERLSGAMPTQVLRSEFVDRVEQLVASAKGPAKRKMTDRLSAMVCACTVTRRVSIKVSRSVRSERRSKASPSSGDSLSRSDLDSSQMEQSHGAQAEMDALLGTPPATVPLSPAAEKGLDVLDIQFEKYFQKLVANSPQLLDSEPDDDDVQLRANRSNPEIVNAARQYLAKSSGVSDAATSSPNQHSGKDVDSESMSPDWLEAAKLCSRNAEQARLAATEALDRLINVDSPSE